MAYYLAFIRRMIAANVQDQFIGFSGHLLIESGSFLLLESGSKILLE